MDKFNPQSIIFSKKNTRKNWKLCFAIKQYLDLSQKLNLLDWDKKEVFTINVLRQLKNTFENRNIAEMAVIWSISCVFAALYVGLFAHLLSSFIKLGNYAGPVFVGLWVLLVFGFWLYLVILGRRNKALESSEGDLIKLQMLGLFLVIVHWLRGWTASDSEETKFWGIAAYAFEWIMIVFQVVYFTLSWGIGARIPFKTYLQRFRLAHEGR